MKHRNFRYFISGQCISLIGTFVQATAQQWLVYSTTKSPFLLGLLGAFQFGPVLLLSLFAGVYIDRFPKRRILLATQTVFMVQSLLLALFVWSGHVQYWQIAMLAVVFGITQTFDLPVRQSFAVELVGREDLMNAISLTSTAVNLSKILGPVIAGIIIVTLGPRDCFLINGLSFLPVIYGLYKIDAVSYIKAKSNLHPAAEIKDGIAYIFKNRLLWFTALMMAVVCTFSANTQIILPVFTTQALKMGAGEYSLLLSAMGAGALFGALFMASRAKKGINTAIIIWDSIALALVQVTAFFLRDIFSTAIAVAVIGFLFMTFLNMANSTLQVNSGNEYRGRVMSIYSLLIVGTSPLGNSLTGYAMQLGGGSAGFLLCGAFTLVFSAPVLLYFKFKRKKTVEIDLP
jgi:MFS family permease